MSRRREWTVIEAQTDAGPALLVVPANTPGAIKVGELASPIAGPDPLDLDTLGPTHT